MHNTLFRQRPNPQISRPQKRLVPVLRTNPLEGYTAKLYPLNRNDNTFAATPRDEAWPKVYDLVLKLLEYIVDDTKVGKKVKAFVSTNPTWSSANSGDFLATTYTIALWFGFVTPKGKTALGDRSFKDLDDYYQVAIALLVALSKGDTGVVSTVKQIIGAGREATPTWQASHLNQDHEDFIIGKWFALYNTASTIISDPSNTFYDQVTNYIAQILATPIQLFGKKSPQFLSEVDADGKAAWLSPSYTAKGSASSSGAADTSARPEERQAKAKTKIQEVALKQQADARITRFQAAYGSNPKRVKQMLPYAFNIYYNGRTGDIPPVQEWTIPGTEIHALVRKSTYSVNDKESYPITEYIKEAERNAIIVYARLNGNAQVFITTQSPASNLGRKHTGAPNQYYIPIIEMTSFPEATALIASGLVSNGVYRYDGKGTTYDALEVPCCAPHTGFGVALVFAQHWRQSNLRYTKMDIIVYQEKMIGNESTPVYMGYDPGLVTSTYGYNAENVWNTYREFFQVGGAATPEEDVKSRQEYYRNEDAPTSDFTFADDEEEEPSEKTYTQSNEEKADADKATSWASEPDNYSPFDFDPNDT